MSNAAYPSQPPAAWQSPRYLQAPVGARRAPHPSLFASLALGLTFNASFVAVMGPKAGFIPSGTGPILSALSMLFLIVFTMFRKKQFTFASLPSSIKNGFIIVAVATMVSAIISFGNPDTPRNLRTGILLKSFGTLLTFYALASSARVFSQKEVVRSLLIFATIESIGCMYLYYFNVDVNPNAVSVRACVAGMCFFSIYKSRAIKFAAILFCLGFAVKLSCRTTSVALLASIAFLYVEKYSRRQRSLVLFLTIAAAVVALVFMPAITSGLQDVAVKSLGSQNPIAKFFLHDKTSKKIDVDYLDRQEVWENSIAHIKARPLLGYGIGTETELMGKRSHNAYLSLIFEGGVFFLIAWMYFYLPFLLNLLNKKWVADVGDMSLYFLTMLLLVYMMLAALVETSGLASISTPNNIIFVFLVAWLFQPKPDR